MKARAWIPLGYGSWKEYVEREFGMKERNSFYILNQGYVIQAFEEVIEETAARPCSSPEINQWQARHIKPHLAEALAEVRESIASGVDPVRAVNQDATDQLVSRFEKTARSAQLCTPFLKGFTGRPTLPTGYPALMVAFLAAGLTTLLAVVCSSYSPRSASETSLALLLILEETLNRSRAV
jgi:hypothetical protein